MRFGCEGRSRFPFGNDKKKSKDNRRFFDSLRSLRMTILFWLHSLRMTRLHAALTQNDRSLGEREAGCPEGDKRENSKNKDKRIVVVSHL